EFFRVEAVEADSKAARRRFRSVNIDQPADLAAAETRLEAALFLKMLINPIRKDLQRIRPAQPPRNWDSFDAISPPVALASFAQIVYGTLTLLIAPKLSVWLVSNYQSTRRLQERPDQTKKCIQVWHEMNQRMGN